MANLLNVKLQEIHEGKRDYLRYKGRDGRYHFLDTKEMPDSDTNSVTYGQLVEMRQAALLEPGMLYRITDYATTTVQENTRSAGNQFDIVVMALDSKTLAERAWAMPHSGDTYFAASNLKAWRLLYSLENDISRFSWADPENGKGVIYRLIDEWGNDCPYDFKNIQFKRWAVSSLTNDKLDSDSLDELAAQFVYDADENPFCFARQNSNYTSGSTSFVVNNEVSKWYYTFSVFDEEGAVNDYSLRVYDYYVDGAMAVAQGNVMLPAQACDDEDVYHYVLNNNVFIDKYDEEEEWYTVSFGNSMKENCQNNTFSANCRNNTFSANCGNNTFSAGCWYNTFSADCWNNTFSAGCYNNTFSAECSGNTFSAGCCYNTFSAGCYNNTFSANCLYNTFSASCSRNTFSANCQNNTFSAYCSNNTFSANVQSCELIKDYTRYVIIENGNTGIKLTSTQTTSQASQLQNILIALGTNMSGSKTISHNTIGDTFKTTYQNTNSDVVDV